MPASSNSLDERNRTAGHVALRDQNELVQWFAKTQSLEQHSRTFSYDSGIPMPSRDIAQLVSVVTVI